MKILSGVIALLLLLAGAVWWVGMVKPSAEGGVGLVVENARVRMLPGDRPMAGYMKIHNRTEQPWRLIDADSEAFGRVMIHRTRVGEGRARMQHQRDGVSINSGETLEFKPRGLHLMLMDRTSELKIGDQVDIVLSFETLGSTSSARDQVVPFTVVPVASQ
ncbi:MAG: copper chaperone PCu(A)C [Xanthomonadaceae bacterium]|nr:copper chaperone PCu(A)C [Xanthomonadaceae bacterium]